MLRLLHPDPDVLRRPTAATLRAAAAAALLGFALYGFTIGFWRSPLMGLYVAIKMPLLIVATLACNGLLNGLLGLLLGSGLGFRHSLQALLSAFAISGLVLGSLAPITLFLATNAPQPDAPGAGTAYATFLVSHTALIAVAGATGLWRLRGLLRRTCPDRRVAESTFLAWLAGNALLGAQLAWVLRPFFGSPDLGVAFLRDRPLEGNFYEALWFALQRLPPAALPLLAVAALVLIAARPKPGPARRSLPESTP